MPSSPELLRVGLIGAGGIVRQRHLPGFEDVPNLQITAVANSTVDSAQRFIEEHAPGAVAHDEWEAVAASDDVDVVWVGATPYLHADATCHALKCGKHVFCQARMAAELPDAERMWETSLSHPELVTGLCPAPHGMKHGEMLMKLLHEGAIGRPHQVVLHAFGPAWLDPTQPAHWRQKVEVSGVQILTLGIFTEVIQRWLGPIAEVKASGNVVFRERDGYTVETPDFVHVLARFQNDVEGTLLFSGVAAHAPPSCCWIFGTEGTIKYEFDTDELLIGRRSGTFESVPVPLELVREWMVEEDFFKAVRDPSAPRPQPDFVEGLCYMRVVDAVWKSMAEGRAVPCA
jgi:predicted dehydrogenase